MAIERGSIVGFEMKMYWDSTGSTTPTWVEVVRVKDLAVTNTKGQADVSRRESNYMLFAGGQSDLGLEFGYQYYANRAAGGDLLWEAFQDSYNNNTPLHLLVVDGNAVPASGETTRGLELWVVVFDFPHDEGLSEGVVYNITAKPTDVYDNGTLLVPVEMIVTTA
jgi:hypothetical protein